MTNSYPIKVWSGLLSDGHTQKIENALWEFIWLVNKVTKEEDGIGYVLRGKPIKVNDIAKDLKRNYRAVLRHLKKLKDCGYITLKRCPYGFVITINNSKKFQKRYDKDIQSGSGESVQKCQRECTKMSERVYKNVQNKLRYRTDIKQDIKSDIKKIFDEQSEEYKLSLYLFKGIKENNPEAKEPNFQMWAKNIDLMARIDKRKPEKIKQIIDWIRGNDFWYKVILSTENLRKNFDRLEMQSQERKGKGENENIKSYRRA
ncbi:MAG: winged helix-turn-helix transcriptional regulator [Actinobacteria bacterium]|nr:winged helix-turn-helix transcriptional regulator [Actinomycetota bacterium]